MPRFTVLVLVALFGPFASAADSPTPVAVRVLTADGKPVTGAKVWVYEYTGVVEESAEPKPLVTDANGKVSVSRVKANRPMQLFARDDAGRVGWVWISIFRDDSEPSAEIKVALVETAERSGRITSSDGKPVANAVVTPTTYSTEEASRRGVIGASISLPAGEQKRLVARTDAEGRFKLVAPTTGYTVSYSVKAEGVGESRWIASSGVDLETKLFASGTATVTATGIEPSHSKGVVIRLHPVERPAEKLGVQPVRYLTGSFSASGTVTLEGVIPGKYDLFVDRNAQVPGVFEKGESFEVVSGKATAVTAKFGPAAKVTGQITDKETGKGLASVRVIVNITDGQSPQPRQQMFVETDQEGKFTAHGSAGWYAFWLQTAPDGYAIPPPTGPRRGGTEPVKVDAGKAHTFAPLALPKAMTFTGKVVTVEGKPAAGATVSVGSLAFQSGSGKATTDKDGNFAIRNLAPDDAVAPRVRFGKAVNVPQTFELEKTIGPVNLEVSEENAAGFRGRVTDGKGKPVVGAKVQLRHSVAGVGRNAGFSSYGPVATASTDADGRYSFGAYWPRDHYGLLVTADGYTEGEAKQLVGEAGEVREFPDIKLTRANLTVSGIVVGSAGKPLAGVEVFSVDGPTRFATTSGSDGTFTLTGFNDGAAFVFARESGYRMVAVPVFPAKPDRVTVPLTKVDDVPPAPPEVSAAHRAALDTFTRHALTLVWESHAKFGYGGNALGAMAGIDVDTAKKWRDEEKKRTGGKDFTRLLDRARRQKTLFATARDDIDEALAVIGGLGADDGFTEAMRVGELMLAVDKAKALRLAEEAVVKARQREVLAKIWALAEAGDLAVRAGSAGGKKIIAEAAELAAKLTPDERGRNSLAIGTAAAYLAPHDWAKAEELLKTLKDPSDYNRYLSAAATRLARTDLDRAKKLFERFKPDNGFYPQTVKLHVAFTIVKEQPDEATKLVHSVTEQYYRFLGLVQLAVHFAPTDKARAVKTMDAAFDMLDRDPDAFRSWSSSAGRAGLAALATVRAKEIGHPDVASLVARTLALRPTGRDAWSPESREEQLVNIAAALALVDPTAARHVLAGIAPPDEFVTRAVAQRRDWLFALALADPQRATTLADKLIERAKNARGGRNGLSETGLVELGSILTGRDVLRELTHYGNLPRENEGD